MHKIDQYANYTAIELAADTEFIKWVKFRDKASNKFWTAFLEKYPSRAAEVNKAEAIVSEMRIVTEPVTPESANKVWGNIQQAVQEMPAVQSGGRRINMARWWAAAAAVVLVLATSGYFFFKNNSSAQTAGVTEQQKTIQNDIEPGSDKAVLTLADGTKVVLDTANNGTISQQGRVTIIKLDGKLAYQATTSALSAPKEVTYNTITTPKGGQYQLELADGSKVWLNAASSLRFPTGFAGTERRVQLTGEGYFEVAHNSAMPFIVETGAASVRVLGTQFNINGYEDEAQTNITLLEGSVKITKGSNNQLLKPGQQAQVSGTIKVVSDVNTEKVLAWKNGWFEFDETDLSAIMRQVSRWYDVEIVYEGKVTNQQFGGRISKYLPISALTQMLESNGVKGFRLEGKTLIVQP